MVKTDARFGEELTADNLRLTGRAHPDTQYDLGVMHLDAGEGEAARVWLTLAAEQGHQKAQYNLGHMYTTGECGIEQSYEKAKYWYDKSAETGFRPALMALGFFYQRGLGVEINHDTARLYFERGHHIMRRNYEKLAEEGDAESQFELGMIYGTGHYVEKDMAVAEKWLQKAADQGHDRAAAELKNLKQGIVL